MLTKSEFKRVQGPPVIRVSVRGFKLAGACPLPNNFNYFYWQVNSLLQKNHPVFYGTAVVFFACGGGVVAGGS